MEVYKPTRMDIRFSVEEMQVISKAENIFENVLEEMQKNDFYRFYYGDTVMTDNDLTNFIGNFCDLLSGKDIYLDD